MSNGFGLWLKEARLGTVDPRSGRPYSQARLAREMGISPSKVAAWERGAITSVLPKDAHMLARLLNRTERELLEALGYEVGNIALSDEERQLLAAYRQLPPPYSTVEKERLRLFVRLLRQSGQTI
jgi:transcriptional regulator with XRE-family HTH domain